MDETTNLILVVNSLTEQEKQQLPHKIKQINSDTPTCLHLLYVKPRLPTCYFHIPSMVSLAKECEAEAETTLREISDMLNVPEECKWVEMGKIKTETERLAKRLDASFILTSATENQNMIRRFGLRRAGSGRHFETISDIGNVSFQAALSH